MENTGTLSEPVEPLLSVRELRRVLGGISDQGVYRLIGRGELHPIKVGGRTMFTPSDVRAFIERAQIAAQEPS